MAKGFINITHSGNGSIAYYAREEECLAWWHSNEEVNNVEDLKLAWKQLEKNEKKGNKDLGIVGRYDARVRTNYVLSLPNNLTEEECYHKIENIIDSTEIKNCTYSVFLHRGEKDEIKNFHAHILVNERILATFKKDRVMQRKKWLEKKFRPLYENTFKQEFEQAPDHVPRERFHPALYQSDPKQARDYIQQLNNI